MKITIYTPNDKPLISLPVSPVTLAVIADKAKAAGLTERQYMKRIFTQLVTAAAAAFFSRTTKTP